MSASLACIVHLGSIASDNHRGPVAGVPLHPRYL